MNKKWLLYLVLLFAILGALDSLYLTYEHFQDTIPPCTVNALFSDCGEVLTSKYSEVFGIPLALLGFFHYSLLTSLLLSIVLTGKRIAKYASLALSTFGLLFSIWLVYLQLAVIKAICPYCMLSALISFLLFIFIFTAFSEERKRFFIEISHFLYKKLFKPIFFLMDAEDIHNLMTSVGKQLGDDSIAKSIFRFLLVDNLSLLSQKIAGINFPNPIGLAAGFDYEAQLTQILPTIGFGFESVGTITNLPYGGNPKPRLGRLPKSQSLMVNKGFKSTGAKAVSNRLKNLNFKIPIGISIGRTNSPKLRTQKQSVEDIISAFNIFEKASCANAYYELNISCPNLIHGGNINFYSPKNLEELLSEVDKLQIKKPIFVKMPIEKSDKDVLAMLKVISKHNIQGVVFGNLQKDKADKSLDPSEVKKFKMGNFSGKPTQKRSNELIKLSYAHYKNKLVIIGCGGVFSGKDVYEKITLGASMIQLITGLIFEGPQLAAQINFELVDLLKSDGFDNISQAIGSKNK